VTKSVFEVEVGDIVSIYNQDFITDQVYRLGAGRATMTNYRLKDGSEVKWFAVRKQEENNSVFMGNEVMIQIDEPEECIILDEITYQQVNKTQGRATGTSSMGYPRYLNMEYFDYVAESGDFYLFVQKSDDGIVAFTGEPVISSAVMVFPKPK
jgi:hypothetical protein